MTKTTLCLLMCCLLWMASHAGEGRPKTGKAPSWITHTTVNYSSTYLDEEAEDGYIDLHFEKQVSLATQETYIKKAIRVLSETGVQNYSEVSVSFDPSYEEVIFHSIRIIRKNEVIDELQLSKIRTIQEEKDQQRFQYNGEKTCIRVLEGVQKDDVIEYSYTIKGFNPIFGNKYAAMMEVQFDVPLYASYYKIVVPHSRKIFVRYSHTEASGRSAQTPAGTIYEWKFEDLHPLRPESNLPSWYDAYPTIMVSEYASWNEVAAWASALFPMNIKLSDGLQRKIADLDAANGSPQQKIGAALRFVQDEVRYLGIEMGESSYRPHDPSRVFEQKFGDCKDKSYLLCVMLKGMGIDASPVLINTAYKQTITGWLPSPSIFDHCTVCVWLNGRTYWFDPTIAYQRGPIENIDYPDYGVGLIVNAHTADFATIPPGRNGKVDCREVFHARQENEDVRLEVTTRYTGSYADDMRAEFKGHSLYEMQKTFAGYYANYYDHVVNDSLSYIEEKGGGLTTHEWYTIADFWKKERGHTRATVEPFMINSVLKKAKKMDREMPFGLQYPTRYHEEIVVHLPDGWRLDPEHEQFENAGAKLSYDYSSDEKNTAHLTYEYEGLKDFLDPEEYNTYAEQMMDADKKLAYGFSSADPRSTETVRTNAPLSVSGKFGFMYGILGLLVVLTWFIKKDRRKRAY